MGYKLNSKFLILGHIIKLAREVLRKTTNVGNNGFIRIIQIIDTK